MQDIHNVGTAPAGYDGVLALRVLAVNELIYLLQANISQTKTRVSPRCVDMINSRCQQ